MSDLQVSVEVADFLDRVVPESRQDEARKLVGIFGQATGFPARLWPGAIIGFGRYAYQYDSGHKGQSLATGFSPRKAELSIYILPGYADFGPLLAELGPHRTGKACLYIKRLDRVNPDALSRLIRAGIRDLSSRWSVLPE